MRMNVFSSGEARVLTVSGDRSILAELQSAGFRGIEALCGGGGTCGRCLVTATGDFLRDGETLSLDGVEILACRYRPAGDCRIGLIESGGLQKAGTVSEDIAPCGEGLGVAVDIGTTTVAVYLYDLATGRRLAFESGRNEQRAFGADVISRIQHCSNEGGLAELKATVHRQLDRYIESCLQKAGRSRGEIARTVIAGNTVMEHIYAGDDPTGIGVAPFTPVSLYGKPESDGLYLCPCVAGYVGGDITAGLLSSGAAESEETCLFIDIGTNGEMALGDKNHFTCCATAAGPAFEGAEIECGMSGTAGAISRVRLDDGRIELEVIGGGEATGICGSGLIDALAVLLETGAMSESGRLEHGKKFMLTDKVYISAADIRQLQLAKAAIRAGIETLLETAGLGYDGIGEVLIAGGFGSYMDAANACKIGLLPGELLDRTRHVGNSAGLGAALVLDHASRDRLTELSAKCGYVELSGSALFSEKYIEAMIFD